MHTQITILAAIALLSLSACNNTQQETAQQSAWDEVMVVHDEVMPRMGEINSLTKTIETALADTTLNAELRAEAEQTLIELQAADKAMWDWMYALRQLPDLRASAKHEEIMHYLDTEKTNIAKVKTAMLNSIEAGLQVVSQLPSAMPPADMPVK